MIYIARGTNTFDINKFMRVRNDDNLRKPLGGFWACRKSSDDWLKWCKAEEYMSSESLRKSIDFTLISNSKIYTIDTVEDLAQLIKKYPMKKGFPSMFSKIFPYHTVNWELMSRDYDGVELVNEPLLHWELYGWDINSIVIFNPRVIAVRIK